MAGEVEPRKGSGGLRVLDGVLLVTVGIVGVLVAFWALQFIAGALWELVKLAIIVVIVASVLWMLVGRRRK